MDTQQYLTVATARPIESHVPLPVNVSSYHTEIGLDVTIMCIETILYVFKDLDM